MENARISMLRNWTLNDINKLSAWSENIVNKKPQNTKYNMYYYVVLVGRANVGLPWSDL